MISDILQTSFAVQNREPCERIMKRNNLETEIDHDNLKTTKFNRVLDVFENGRTFPRTTVQRKFPGPAGLLPDDCDYKSISEIFSGNHKNTNSREIFLCSQQNFSVFEKGPWHKMVADFQDPQRELLFEKFNISWIEANFSNKKQMMNCKAPFLACAIDNLELTDGKIPTVKLVLKDKTGTIQGTILHSLYEKYSNYFSADSVLILKQFGVLSAHKSHCITITPNNLLAIYHFHITEPLNMKTESQTTEVKKIVLQEYSVQSIWKKYEESLIKPCIEKNDFKSSFKNRNIKSPKLHNLKNPSMYKKDLPSRNNPITNVTTGKPNILQNFKVIHKSTHSNSPINLSISSSQISVTSDKADLEVWKDLFQEVDTDALFEDF